MCDHSMQLFLKPFSWLVKCQRKMDRTLIYHCQILSFFCFGVSSSPCGLYYILSIQEIMTPQSCDERTRTSNTLSHIQMLYPLSYIASVSAANPETRSSWMIFLSVCIEQNHFKLCKYLCADIIFNRHILYFNKVPGWLYRGFQTSPLYIICD